MSPKTRVIPALRSAGLTQDDRQCERRTKLTYVKLSFPIDSLVVRAFITPDGDSKISYTEARYALPLSICFGNAVVRSITANGKLTTRCTCGHEDHPCDHVLRASVVWACCLRVRAEIVSVGHIVDSRNIPGFGGAVGQSPQATTLQLKVESALSMLKGKRPKK